MATNVVSIAKKRKEKEAKKIIGFGTGSMTRNGPRISFRVVSVGKGPNADVEGLTYDEPPQSVTIPRLYANIQLSD